MIMNPGILFKMERCMAWNNLELNNTFTSGLTSKHKLFI
jgi:hypothetical protein